MNDIITVVLPSINPKTWYNVYHSACDSVGRYDLDFVAVGPYWPEDDLLRRFSNFRFIRSFASPATALQIGVNNSYGRWTTWTSDDCNYLGGKLEEALDYFQESESVGMVARYLEGESHESNELVSIRMGLNYWKCGSHAGTNVYGTNPDWWNAPVGLYETKTILDRGGFDCVNFDHANMGTILFSHDIQRQGLKFTAGPSNLMRASFNPQNNFIWSCFGEKDSPSFIRLSQEHQNYKIVGTPEKYQWRNAESVWSKRWGKS